jgi:hypothetical protein
MSSNTDELNRLANLETETDGKKSSVQGRVIREHSRYPHTYCADYLRMEVGDEYGKGLISRGAAARIKALIAEAIGMDEEDLATAVAEKYIERYSV